MRRARIAVALSLLLPSVATGHGVAVHDAFPERALRRTLTPSGRALEADTLPGLTDADVAAFRRRLYDRAARLGEPSLRRRFLERYPTRASFDERAFREFLMMDGDARVLGVDSFGSVYSRMPERDRSLDPHSDYRPGERISHALALRIGSIYPDLDRRNRDRLARHPEGTPVLAASGDSVPFDPMSLNTGALAGRSSQAHAHQGFRRGAAGDPELLRHEPWNFAVAVGLEGPVETYAPDNAQLYTDLALLALLAGRPAWRTLGAFFAGSAMHYLEDLGNPAHTVQIGTDAIYRDAASQARLRRARRLFGLLGPSPSRDRIAMDIVANLHGLSEALLQRQLLEALAAERGGSFAGIIQSMHGPVAALSAGSDSLGSVLPRTIARLRSVQAAPEFARAIAHVLIDANARDGAELYEVTRWLAIPRLRRAALVVDFDTVPGERVFSYVRDTSRWDTRLALDRFNGIHQRGIARTTEALRWWWGQLVRTVWGTRYPSQYRSDLTEAIVARVVGERLRYLDAAEARRREWIAAHGGLATQ